MSNNIAALVTAIALAGLTLPSWAQGTNAGAMGNGGDGVWQTAALPQQQQQQQQQQQLAGQVINGENNTDQLPLQRQARIERYQPAQDQIRQGINPGLIDEMRDRMRQAGGIGSYQPTYQITPVTANPDNMDAAYGRRQLFAQMMHQHAVLSQPYRIGGN
jgi:hypothetical protein